jgi:hypothetical protein
MTLTSTKVPFDSTGVSKAPTPDPLTWRLGGEL